MPCMLPDGEVRGVLKSEWASSHKTNRSRPVSDANRATPPIYTLDLGMNFPLDKNTFLDVGLNLGLNKAAPKVQIYTGISARF